MQIFITALDMGLVFAIMAMGIFITFKILNLPDLTIDGSFTLGAAVAVMFTVNGHPYLGVVAGFLSGAIAGIVTGFLYTRLNINPILSGILTMTGLYSINLRIMDKKPTVSIFGSESLYTFFERFLPEGYIKLIVNLVLVALIAVLLFCFLKTQLGMSMIAAGDNEDMVRASSINSNNMKLLGLAIGNALVATAGAIMVSYQGFADINSGTGMMVIGIASIIVGEAIFGRKSLVICFVGVIVGSIIYRYILAMALNLGLNAGDLKILSSILVVVAVGLPSISKFFKGVKNAKTR